jgi:carbonic anhydrase
MFCFVVLTTSLFVAPIANALAAAPCAPVSKAKSPQSDRSFEPCDPEFTYANQADWGGACNSGGIQSPINISNAVVDERLSAPAFSYRSAGPSVFNDCNHYTIKVFPAGDSSTLIYGGHPYRLKEFHFHLPAEDLIAGDRSAMEVHLVHEGIDDPKLTLVVAVLVKAGAPNGLIAILWQHIPDEGVRESPPITINPDRLLPPRDKRGFYTFAGSLTTPPCTPGLTWIVLKEPITFSPDQIKRYTYHGTARKDQPVNREIKQTKN